MNVLHIFFGFEGRINRAKVWLYLAIGVAWTIAMMVVALIGLRWSGFFEALPSAIDENLGVFDPAKFVWPPVQTASEWITLGILVLMAALITWVELAVFAKRLHDRNKSAWWLIPYWLLPIVCGLYGALTATPALSEYMTLPGAVASGIASLITLWFYIVMFVLSGTKGSNRFGVDPLEKGPVFCEPGKPVFGCTPAK